MCFGNLPKSQYFGQKGYFRCGAMLSALCILDKFRPLTVNNNNNWNLYCALASIFEKRTNATKAHYVLMDCTNKVHVVHQTRILARSWTYNYTNLLIPMKITDCI